MASIRDFIYLDIPRLESFASQLFEGLPETATKSDNRQTEFGGEIKGKVPFLLEGGADTRAVLSAGSTVTSTLHHQLVVKLIDGLRAQGFLYDSPSDDVPDGGFLLLNGQIQVVDPDTLKHMVNRMPALSRDLGALSAGENSGQPESAVPQNRAARRADQRARRGLQPPPAADLGVSPETANAISGVIDALASRTVRIRILDGDRSTATGVVEPDKFVEDLSRLTARHGYRMGGIWQTLAQLNAPSSETFFAPPGENLLDIVEREALGAMRLFGGMTGAAAESRTITPLAIYRTISPR